MIGLSYSCCPHLDAATFVGLCQNLEINVTDVHPGKVQGWQQASSDPFLQAGIHVVSLNSQIVLGRGNARSIFSKIENSRLVQHSFLRVFLEDGAEKVAIEADVLELIEIGYTPKQIAVETHKGYADSDTISTMQSCFGLSVVLDTLGLWHITQGVLSPTARILISNAAIAHVKGFCCETAGQSLHVALNDEDHEWTTKILELLPTGCPLILETKATSLSNDIAILKKIRNSSHD